MKLLLTLVPVSVCTFVVNASAADAPAAPVTEPLPSAPVGAAAPVPAQKDPPWFERVKVGGFVDAYLAQSWKAPKPAGTATTFRAFDQYKGFNVAWYGLDVAVDPDPVGFVGQLRFGSATPNLALGDATGASSGLAVVQQAYAAYKLSIDRWSANSSSMSCC